ncbi:hypothetical protein [Dysgonomonas macrotermitis]|uniref:Uncharacterized protein n=1 Tax=Dysgonomonas macrotermitis TaxID=1346286 RepID=A0A1M4Y7H1_9BACT|nr:hypothetical protein [Dysgonomonas macrotermitis]SHF01556.1 hypothetical protein SAMN05444362_10392 [Dysgonomonas macrotermitis]
MLKYLVIALFAFTCCSNTKKENIVSVCNIVRDTIPDKETDESNNYYSRAVDIDSVKMYLQEAHQIHEALRTKLRKASPQQADSIFMAQNYRPDHINFFDLTEPTLSRWEVYGNTTKEDTLIVGLLAEEGFEPIYIGEGNADIATNAYWYYNIFEPYVTDAVKGYMKIEADQDRLLSADAGLVVPLNELLDYAIEWEKYLKAYPEGKLRSKTIARYRLYMELIMFCDYDNTPTFDRTTGILEGYILEEIRALARKYPETESCKILQEYLSGLKGTNYKYTKELEDKILSLWMLKDYEGYIYE